MIYGSDVIFMLPKTLWIEEHREGVLERVVESILYDGL